MGLPVEINPLLISSSGYVVGRSLRFRSSASAYLSRTPASAGNRTTWTWSAWVKRGILGTSNQSLFSADTNSGAGNSSSYIWFTSSDTLAISIAAGTYYLNSSSVYRDPSAWYHVVAAYDTTQATASNRLKLYVNGVQLTAFGTATYPTQNYTSNINNNVLHSLSARVYQSPTIDTYTDCYLAEVNFIDGQALTPSSFGAYDTNGVWQPLKYGGTYGTNGFYLPFSDTTSTTTLCYDKSGNGNNWTPNNISLTAGTTYDSMIDSPTVSAISSNYAVLNPVGVPYNTGTAAGGNLNWTGATTADKGMAATISMNSGKWYWECTVTATAAGSNSYAGIVKTAGTSDVNANRVFYNGGGIINKYGTTTSGYSTFTTNDVIGVAYDYSAQTLAFYKNNTLVTTVTGINLEPNLPWVGGYTTTESWSVNFGQRPFSYTPPSGYNALNTYNLPRPTITNGALYNAATLYTGTGASNTISNSASAGGNNALGNTFYPDLTWIKSRSAATDHKLTDSVRGVTKALISDTTGAETTDTNGLTAFSSTGFTVGTDTNYNNNTATYVAWQWLAGAGSSSSNTSGSITSTVSVNTTAGFSIVTYTGNGTAGATVGHGLGVAPNMIIVKNRGNAPTSWAVYHSGYASASYYQFLDTTQAAAANNVVWNGTAPTSSVFSIGTDVVVNSNTNTYVAYCFAAVRGYSAFGSYTGNGSTNGPFVYTGFRPRWIMVKNASAVSNWLMFDTSRATYNVDGNDLYPNLNYAESGTAGYLKDFLSNGFKIRDTGVPINSSGNTYIYAAFAENPFNYSRAR